MTVPEFATRPQLSEAVAAYVRNRIFDGTYAAGEYVRLDQLAAELGISVTPVREALSNCVPKACSPSSRTAGSWCCR